MKDSLASRREWRNIPIDLYGLPIGVLAGSCAELLSRLGLIGLFQVSARAPELLPTTLLYIAPLGLAALAFFPRAARFSWHRMDFLYGLITLLTTVSFLAHSGLPLGIKPLYVAICGFFVYLLARLLSSCGRRQWIAFLLLLLVGLFFVEALHSLLSWGQGRGLKGHLPNPNYMAIELALILPVAASQVWRAGLSAWQRVPAGLIAAIFGFTILVSRCRTAILVAVLGLILLVGAICWKRMRALWRSWPQGFRIAAAGTAAAITVAVLYRMFIWRPISVTGRVFAWKLTAWIISDFPLLGVGFDRFASAINTYQGRYFAENHGGPGEYALAGFTVHAFNDYLETIAQFGLVGLVLWTPFWLFMLRCALRRLFDTANASPSEEPASGGLLKQLTTPWAYEWTSVAGACSALVFLAASITYHLSSVIVPLVFANLAFGLTVDSRQASDASSTGSSRASLRTVSLATLALSSFFLVSGFLHREAALEWRRAEALGKSGDHQAAAPLYASALPRMAQDWDFLLDYGEFLLNSGHPQQSCSILQRALDIYYYPRVLESLARACGDSGDLSTAIDAARKAHFILPWRLTPRVLMAELSLQAGQPEEAFRWALETVLLPEKRNSTAGLEVKARARTVLATAAPLVSSSSSAAVPSDLEFTAADLTTVLAVSGPNRAEILRAVSEVPSEQLPGLLFLLRNMPEKEARSLSAGFLLGQLESAYSVRLGPACVGEIPEEVFLNYVLPYSQIGEPPEDWRTELRRRFAPLVEGCSTLEEAVMALNSHIFQELGVGYADFPGPTSINNPTTSRQFGLANCYGLSILLADACRAVGIPARVATIPTWPVIGGGHSWVEVYDHGRWRFVGAMDQSQLDVTWFRDRLSQTDSSKPEHRIYAASFARTSIQIPRFGPDVWWEDVTERYTSLPPLEKANPSQ